MRNGNKWVALTSLLLVLPLLTAQTHAQQLDNPRDWRSPDLHGHSLTGRIWDANSQQFLTPAEFGNSLEGVSYLLLGEKHDNPDHHALQLEMIEFLLAREQLYQVSFEMMDSAVRERLIDIYLQEPMNDAELQSYLMWDTEGWDWDFYGPLIETAYGAQVRIAAGNITRDEVSSIYQDQLSSRDSVLSEAAVERLHQEIDESHCGMLPESQFPAMVRVQQARDRAMAISLRPPETGKTSVLIAGNFHVRRDLGVPNYLALRHPSLNDESIVALAFMEVEAGQEDPQAYQERLADQLAFDYLWFTPSVGVQDYCAAMQREASQ